jgi:hypothetical protein
MRDALLILLGAAGLLSGPVASAQTPPASLKLQLPLPCSSRAYIYCGYQGQGGVYGSGPLHTGSDAYALDFTYAYTVYSPTNGLGKPIVAVAAGTVAEAGSFSGYGNTVLLSHSTTDGAYYSLYGHLQSCSVQKGQTVSQGQEIGKLGMSGGANGIAHLHFVMRKGGTVFSGPAIIPEPMSGHVGFKAETNYDVTCDAPSPKDAGKPLPDYGGGTPSSDSPLLFEAGLPPQDLSLSIEKGSNPIAPLRGSCALTEEGDAPSMLGPLLLGLLLLSRVSRARIARAGSRQEPRG